MTINELNVLNNYKIDYRGYRKDVFPKSKELSEEEIIQPSKLQSRDPWKL